MNKAFAAATCLGLLTISSAMADQWNKKTYLTVNEPVSVPGKVLQPGRYVMKLLDSPSNRHIVQIYNDREDQLQTTVLAIPNYRLQPTGKTEFQWWETPAGQPKAMRAWFYPGDNFGQEFAYPKTQAVSIAASNSQSVPTTYAQTESELTTARVGTVDKAGTEMELDRQTYTAPQKTQQMARNTPQPETVAQVTPRATPQATQQMAQNTAPAADDSMRTRTLPRTGSEMPLFGLAGFLALGAGSLIRAIGRR